MSLPAALRAVAAPDAEGPPAETGPLAAGIDLGTSCSAVARLDRDGVPRLLADAEGRELVDSILAFDADGGVHVGRPDDSRPFAGPLVTAIKRQLGRPGFSLRHHGRRLTPEMLSALLLRKLAADAGRRGALSGVVLTVPSYFFSPGREATLAAGRLAGLPIDELLAEPTAAALAHLWRTGADLGPRTMMVFDLGGGTFDVTVLRVDGGRLVVAATEGDNDLGGIDWTARIVEFAAEKFRRRHGVDPRRCPDGLWRLTDACERAKVRLAVEERVVIDVTHAGVTMPLGLSRDEFEQLTADLLRRLRDATEFLFESSGFEPDDLDELLLVGGGTKMPCVAAMLAELYGRPVTTSPDPQRVVAEGAAVYAAAVAARRGNGPALPPDVRRRLDAIALQDVNAHSLGIALDPPRGKPGSRNHIVLPRNTPLPAVIHRRFVTSLADPEGIALRLVEGEAPETANCTVIGDWRITGLPPNLPAGSPVEVTFRCDRQRRVTVEARELTGSTPARVERVVTGTAPDADLRRLIADFRLT